jgi:hypothetical protein
MIDGTARAGGRWRSTCTRYLQGGQNAGCVI